MKSTTSMHLFLACSTPYDAATKTKSQTQWPNDHLQIEKRLPIYDSIILWLSSRSSSLPLTCLPLYCTAVCTKLFICFWGWWFIQVVEDSWDTQENNGLLIVKMCQFDASVWCWIMDGGMHWDKKMLQWWLSSLKSKVMYDQTYWPTDVEIVQ